MKKNTVQYKKSIFDLSEKNDKVISTDKVILTEEKAKIVKGITTEKIVKGVSTEKNAKNVKGNSTDKAFTNRNKEAFSNKTEKSNVNKNEEENEKTVFDKFVIKEPHKNVKASKKQKRNHDIKNGVKKPKIEIEEVKKEINKKEVRKEINKKESNKADNKKEVKKESNKADNKKEVKKADNKKEITKKEEIGVKLTKLETEILHKGTIKDKINLLTLIVEKNPSDFNYKNLLFYTENQRNDIIYMTLKNIKDLLISKGVPKTNYIKQKITKSFDINVKNTFIKTKVLRLVYELLKNNILFIDLIYSFINKIGDKKEIETYVRENLMTLFTINEEAILYNVEDFIFKNMNFKCTNSILKFLGSVAATDKLKMIELSKLILDNVHEFKDEQKNIILENCLEQLSSLLEDIENPKDFMDDKLENILRTSYSTDKIAFAGVKIFYICESKILKPFIVQLLKNHIFIRSKNLKDIFKFITKLYKTDKDNEFIKEIFNSTVFYRKEFLISILSILIKNKISDLYLLDILRNHYSNIVRKMVESLLNKDYEMVEVDPFDKIQLEAYEDILK